ncbi:hypothetical protein BDP27DRAFT_1440683 [Rhodocollybia butyracea]|uniref:Uncharacterized protein n=1 Tax=Rhodocollybia butyracea TaxID=206335 RepID=A0A9P5P3Y8_9AGAR|nr:hypothetical protein BDP27DRAFT_1440683 [Rhodocollybia butyracea]
MPSSNTDSLSTPTNVAVHSNRGGSFTPDLAAKIEALKEGTVLDNVSLRDVIKNEQDLAAIIEALKEGTALDNVSLRDVMENEQSRAYFMKALADNAKLSQSMATDFPDAIEITDRSKAA